MTYNVSSQKPWSGHLPVYSAVTEEVSQAPSGREQWPGESQVDTFLVFQGYFRVLVRTKPVRR